MSARAATTNSPMRTAELVVPLPRWSARNRRRTIIGSTPLRPSSRRRPLRAVPPPERPPTPRARLLPPRNRNRPAGGRPRAGGEVRAGPPWGSEAGLAEEEQDQVADGDEDPREQDQDQGREARGRLRPRGGANLLD